MKIPRIVDNGGQMVAPPRERHIPLAEAEHSAIIGFVRDRLRPTTSPPSYVRSTDR